MFFSHRSPDYLTDIERIGSAAVFRFRAKEAEKAAQVERQQQFALKKLKLLAVEHAVTIERLKWSSSATGPRLHDPAFKRTVQDTAAALLFQSYLHLSVDG